MIPFVSGLILLVAVTVPGIGTANEEEEVILLEDLVEEARSANPQILALHHASLSSSHRAQRMGSWPQPRLNLIIRNVGFDELTIGEEMMSATGIMATQDVPFPGKLGLRESSGRLETRRVSETLRATELNVISAVRQTYYELYFVYRSLETVQKKKRLLEDVAEIAAARYEVGSGAQHDLVFAQLEISKAIEESLKLEQRKETVKAELNTQLSRPPDSPLGRPTDLLQPPPIAYTLDQVLDLALSNSPVVEASRLDLQRTDSMYELARMEYLPDFQLSAGYMSRGEFDDIWEVRVGVKLPLYFWGKPRHTVMEAEERNLSAGHLVRSTEQEVIEKTTALWQQIQTTGQLVSLYETAIVPQAKMSFESALSSYRVGKNDFATLVASVVTLLEYELAYHNQLADLNKKVAMLEEVVGAAITNVDQTGGTN